MCLCDIAVHPELLEGESHKLSLLQTRDKKKLQTVRLGNLGCQR